MASALWLPVIFLTAVLYLYSLARYRHLAVDSDSTTRDELYFPASMEELKNLAATLQSFNEKHPVYVFILFISAYVFKQTFAIPGSVFLNILSGAIYSRWFGFPLVCLLSAIGATNCYLLSATFGSHLVMSRFENRLEPVRRKLDENRAQLFPLLLSLRFMPMAPNWLMNMAAPLLGVPVHLFFCSVLIGLMPYNYLCVQGGEVLASLSSTNQILSTPALLKMLFAAAVALLPTIFVKWRGGSSPELDRNK